MRYEPLPAKFHIANRAKLAQAIGPQAVAIIDTADVLSRPGDFEYPFRPDSDFYYLTGIDEPQSVLLLMPGHTNEKLREILFIHKTDEFHELWEGKRLSQDEAKSRSGVEAVMWLEELDGLLERALSQYQTVYLNNHPSVAPGPLNPSGRRALQLRRQLPTHQLKSATSLLGEFRTVKAPAEVAQIRRAISLTGKGLSRAWAVLKPGVPEYALEAELTAEFMRGGATGSGFSAIVAAGKNAATIHHHTGTSKVAPGELVLFDVGAEAGYYAADISRTVPVDGKFTPRQRAVYQAVLRAQSAGIAHHRPGTTILEIDEVMRKVLLEEVVKLGLVTAAAAAGPDAQQQLRQYYPHISHHLGLGVHDTGSPNIKLAPGMVVTCEPGLYLPEESLGVRLEDVILITDSGHEVLSSGIPSDPDHIEELLLRYRTSQTKRSRA